MNSFGIWTQAFTKDEAWITAAQTICAEDEAMHIEKDEESFEKLVELEETNERQIN